MRPMPMMPSRLPHRRRPSIQVGDQPWKPPACTTAAPSTMRRVLAMIRLMVRSAVSSVRTPGVLVTMKPRWLAVATSMLSTPAPKLAISFSRSPARDSRRESSRSVMVGTSTSQRPMASTSSSAVIGRSSTLSSVSKSSRIRVSTGSGSLRVTMTFGFLAAMDAFGADVGPLKGSANP